MFAKTGKARSSSSVSASRRPAGMVPSEARAAGREPSGGCSLEQPTAYDTKELLSAEIKIPEPSLIRTKNVRIHAYPFAL